MQTPSKYGGVGEISLLNLLFKNELKVSPVSTFVVCALGFVASGSKEQLWRGWISVVQWPSGQRCWCRTALRAWRWKRGASEGFDKPRSQERCSWASIVKEQTTLTVFCLLHITVQCSGLYTHYLLQLGYLITGFFIIIFNFFLLFAGVWPPLLQTQSIAYLFHKKIKKIRNLLLCLQS